MEIMIKMENKCLIESTKPKVLKESTSQIDQGKKRTQKY